MKYFIAIALFSGLAYAFPGKKEVPFNEDDLAHAMLHKRGDEIMGVSVPMIKSFIKKTLENPAVKKLANPKILEQFLNQDYSGQVTAAVNGVIAQGGPPGVPGPAMEIFDLIMTSEIVKAWTDPAVFQMIVNSKAAKSVFNKEFVLHLLENPAIKSLLSPETIHKVLDSENIANMFQPEFLAAVLDNPTILTALDSMRNFDPSGIPMANSIDFHSTKVFKAVARFEFIKVFLHSQFARKFFSWGSIHAMWNLPAIADGIITPANTKEFWASPLMQQMYDPTERAKLYDSKVMNALLAPANMHEVLYSETIAKLATGDHLAKVFGASAFTNGVTDASVADYVASPAVKNLMSEDTLNKVIATPSAKAFWHNADVKAWLANMNKIYGAA